MEIKFRLWNCKSKEMQGKEISNYFSLRCDGKVNMSSNMLTDKDLILIQFTGLKDKNGKEIYVGDIVELTEDYSGGEIIFDESTCSFRLRILCEDGTFDNFTDYLPEYVEQLKVIGNKFENPELLDAKRGNSE